MELRTIPNNIIFFSSLQDEVISSYPLEYVKWVAKQLNCKKSDLRLLMIHPDFEEDDEEGWGVESFFSAKTEINREVIHSDGEKEILHFETFIPSSFAIGEVLKLQVNGKTLIADHNTSPCTVWINEADLW